MGVCYKYSNTEILDDKLACVSTVDKTFNFSCYDLEYLKNILNRWEASVPDNTTTSERSKLYDRLSQL